MTDHKSMLACCICDDEIEVEPMTGWSEGHNASPVVTMDDKNNEYKDTDGKVVEHGRCCDVCNFTKVIPARMQSFWATY